MKEKMNIGLVGYGSIGRIHSLSYRQLPFIYPGAPTLPHLYAVCTSREESARAAQKEAGFELAASDVDSFVQNPAIDIIDITAPNHVHRAIVEASLAAGKHVYCEKPLAGSIEDARAIAKAAAAAGTCFGMVFQYRFIPAIRRAKELIDAGKIGRVYTFRAEYLHSGYQNPDRPLSWRMKKDQGGSGALGDLGSHVIDLMRYLIGEFDQIQGHLETFIRTRPVTKGASEKGDVTVDDVAWLRARMKGGAVGTIEASRFATGTLDDLRFWVYGENGALRFDLMDPGFLYWFDEKRAGGSYGGERGWQRLDTMQHYPGAKAPPARAPIGWTRAHAENQYQFIQAVADGREPSPGAVDGLLTQLVIDATERSHAAGGAWTPVADE